MRSSRLIIRLSSVCIFLVSMRIAVGATGDFPTGVTGVAYYDYFTECLPPQTSGIYKINSLENKEVKYVGSTQDINKRLADHARTGTLTRGDMIEALIFHSKVQQNEILIYEKELIKTLSPRLNKHPGTPGRPWRTDQMHKLQLFFEHNKPFLTPQGQREICNLLNGKSANGEYQLMRGLCKVLKLFR